MLDRKRKFRKKNRIVLKSQMLDRQRKYILDWIII